MRGFIIVARPPSGDGGGATTVFTEARSPAQAARIARWMLGADADWDLLVKSLRKQTNK
jgi:hypothetical protein